MDVITGSLGLALGAYGGFAACDHVTARYLVNSARTLIHSTAPSPVAIAAAMAALDLLEEQPRRIEKLQANADALRDGLAREGFDIAGAQGHVVSIVVGDAERAQRIVDAAVEQGAFIEAVLPPAVPDGTARLRLAVMASHTRPELREAAVVAGARVHALRLPPGRGRAGRGGAVGGAGVRRRRAAARGLAHSPAAYSTSDSSTSHSTGAWSSV